MAGLVGAGSWFLAPACNPVVRAASEFVRSGNRRHGVTFYVGGAGPIGHLGALSIPQGLADAGYRGYVEVFAWQSVTAALDQVALERNRSKGAELANLIRRQKRRYPDAAVNVIALSAGSGVATFALERLPENVKVDNVVFFASSLSSRYDLTRALKRVDRALFSFYSPSDPILQGLVPIAGTVDRRDAEGGVAGLRGFQTPDRSAESMDQYAKLHNVRYRSDFARYGYEGGHTDATSRDFIRHVVAPLILRSTGRADHGRPAARSPAAAQRWKETPHVVSLRAGRAGHGAHCGRDHPPPARQRLLRAAAYHRFPVAEAA